MMTAYMNIKYVTGSYGDRIVNIRLVDLLHFDVSVFVKHCNALYT